jgi:hypothetical protein
VRQPSALRCFGFGKANPWLGEPPARVDGAEPSALRCFGFSETPCMVTRVLDLLSYKSLESPTRVSRESSTIGNRDAILGYVSLRLLFVGPLTGAFGFWFILVVFRA